MSSAPAFAGTGFDTERLEVALWQNACLKFLFVKLFLNFFKNSKQKRSKKTCQIFILNSYCIVCYHLPPSLGMAEAKQIKKLTKAEANKIEELNNQIKKLEEQLTPLNKKIDSLNKQLKSLSEQTKPIYKQIHKLKNQIGKIKGIVIAKDCYHEGKHYPSGTAVGPFVCVRSGQWMRR